MSGYWKQDKGEIVSNSEKFVPKETVSDIEQYGTTDLPIS